MSVNDAWQGKRYKTEQYKAFEKLLLVKKETKVKIPKGNLTIKITFGFSNSGSDWDNPIKPFVDILQKRNNFNDSRIYEGIVKKIIVPKGEEFIEFEILPYNNSDWIKKKDQEPTKKDLPFITFGKKLNNFPKSNIINEVYDLWDDSDWFLELSNEEKFEWVYWKRLIPPTSA